MSKQKPPLGVMPYRIWADGHIDPSVTEVIARRDDVKAAIRRYEEAGLDVPASWVTEVSLRERQIRRMLKEDDA